MDLNNEIAKKAINGDHEAQEYLLKRYDKYLELSSQMQRYIKINFKRRFPVQAFAWTLI